LEAQPATAIDPALTVTDSDSANLTFATVQITGNYFAGQDVLAFSPIGAITGAFDAVHGTLTLTGANTYVGGTQIDGGNTLSIAADNNIGGSAGALIL
ncbi:autotransporter-associated beta strand repeat-containing protein, partial [Acinetobacter baumannii]